MMIKTYITDKYHNYQLAELDLSTNDLGKKVVIVRPTGLKWLGFGGAFTEASGYVYHFLDEKLKAKVIELYFDYQKGLGYTWGRIPIASCDFSLGPYDYLESGTLDYTRDNQYTFPLIKDVLEKYPLSFLVSPWSPPASMKTNNARTYGGALKQECYLEYATYLKDYLVHLKKDLGIMPKYITVQNEPAATQTWDSCIYSPLEEFNFVKEALAPVLKQNQINIDILVWDHNRDIMYERVSPIYELDKDNLIKGCAIHWYDNEPFDNIKKVKAKYPDRLIIHSESCIEGGPHFNFYEGAERYARNIIGDMRGGTQGFIDWNIFLDYFGGPNWVGNMCVAPIMIDTKNNEFSIQKSYYGIGQLAKFIRPGDELIEANIENTNLYYVLYQNSKQMKLVLLNQTESDEVICFMEQNYLIPKRSIVTIIGEIL